MKISQAFRDAGRVYFGHMGDTVRFLIVELCMTLMGVVPLLFLFEEKLRYLALLSIPLLLLILFPARINAAQAMRDALMGGRLFSLRLVDPSDYGKKLGCALKRLLFLLLWSVPLIGSLFLIWTHVSGEMDGFTLMRMIRSDFGGGDLVRGVLVIVLAVAAAMLLVVFGCAFHSGARHAFAQGDVHRVKGHHGKILLTWFCALVCVLPLIAAFAIALTRYMPALSDLNGLFMNTVNLPSTRGTLMILAVGALLTIPLLPLRSLITAALVHSLENKP